MEETTGTMSVMRSYRGNMRDVPPTFMRRHFGSKRPARYVCKYVPWQIQDGVSFLDSGNRRGGRSSHSAVMASTNSGGRVSCGRDLNCVPEIADTLAAVAKLG